MRLHLLRLLPLLALLLGLSSRSGEAQAARGSEARAPSQAEAKSLSKSEARKKAKAIAAYRSAMTRAVNALQQKQYKKARSLLKPVFPPENLALLYRQALLLQAEEGLKDYRAADGLLTAIFRADSQARAGGNDSLKPLPGPFRRHFLERRFALLPKTHPSDSARRVLCETLLAADLTKAQRFEVLWQLLRLRDFQVSPVLHQDLLRPLLALGYDDDRLDTVYRAILADTLARAAPTDSVPKTAADTAPRVAATDTALPRAPAETSGKALPPAAAEADRAWEWQTLILDLEEKLGLYAEGRRRCEALVKGPIDVEKKRQLHFIFSRLYFKGRDFANAAKYYKLYLDRYGDSPDVLLQIARAQDRLGQTEEAAAWYDRFLKTYPQHDKTSEILWLKAWELEAAGKHDEAIAVYRRQLPAFANNRRGAWALFRIGFSSFKAGNFADALASFAQIRAEPAARASASAGLLWEGRAAEALADTVRARAAYGAAATLHPYTFYGHLAAVTLKDRAWWTDSLEAKVRPMSRGAAEVKAWLSELPGFSDSLENDGESEYLGLGKLLQLRLDTLALLTLRSLPAAAHENPWFLYTYSRLFQKQGLYRDSYRLGLQLAARLPAEKWAEAPKEVLRLAYPTPYPDLVLQHAVKRNVDPNLIYALMRQESAFDREIRSSAGAVGLMQIIPPTARTLARDDRMKRFEIRQLVLPEVNIRLGTLYLSQLLREYGRNPYFVLANYNAGPDPAKRWRDQHGDKPVEVMVEEISYWETRDYLKKVMGNYWTYGTLWREGK